jgi:outer membrane protein assembly factor BamB
LAVRWATAEPEKPIAAAPDDGVEVDWAAVGRRLLLSRQPVGKPAEVWSYGAPMKGADGQWSPDVFFLATPAVRNGVVYAATCEQDVFGYIGSVVALDAGTNRLLWKRNTPADGAEPFRAFYSSPTLTPDGRRLLIGQGLHEHENCELLCLDTATGAVLWRAATPTHIESTPAVHGDRVVVGVGAIEDANKQPKGERGYVLAVQISTGQVLWRHPLADAESSPAIADDGVVYIGSGFNGNAVVALRPETDAELTAAGLKRELWRAPTSQPVTGPVTLAGERVFVGVSNCDVVNVAPVPAGGVQAMDRRTGRVIWTWDAGDAVLGAVTPVGDRLVVPIRGGGVALLDAASGTPLWRSTLPGGSPLLTGCCVDGGHVFAVTRDGVLHMLRLTDGRPMERVPLSHPERPATAGYALSTPVVVGDRLFVGTETGGLKCLAIPRRPAGP